MMEGFRFSKYATGFYSPGKDEDDTDDIYFMKFGRTFSRNFSTATHTALLIKQRDCRTRM
jgi:hypothetical protein